MIGRSAFLLQVFFHQLPVVLQVVQLQFGGGQFEGVDLLQDFQAQIEELGLRLVRRIPDHLDLDQLLLLILLWVKNAVNSVHW